MVPLAAKGRIDPRNRDRMRFGRERETGGDFAGVPYVDQEIQTREPVLPAHGSAAFRQLPKTGRAEDTLGAGLGREPPEVGQKFGCGVAAALVPRFGIDAREVVRAPSERTSGEAKPQMKQRDPDHVEERLPLPHHLLGVDCGELLPRVRHLRAAIQVPLHLPLNRLRQEGAGIFPHAAFDGPILMDGSAHLEHGSARRRAILRHRLSGSLVQQIRDSRGFSGPILESPQPLLRSEPRALARPRGHGVEGKGRKTNDQKRRKAGHLRIKQRFGTAPRATGT